MVCILKPCAKSGVFDRGNAAVKPVATFASFEKQTIFSKSVDRLERNEMLGCCEVCLL